MLPFLVFFIRVTVVNKKEGGREQCAAPVSWSLARMTLAIAMSRPPSLKRVWRSALTSTEHAGDFEGILMSARPKPAAPQI